MTQLKFGQEVSELFLAKASKLSHEHIDLLSGRMLSASTASTFCEGMRTKVRSCDVQEMMGAIAQNRY